MSQDIIIAAIGKMKAEERGLYQRYATRLRWKLKLAEGSEVRSMAQEARWLASAIAGYRSLVVLDERGKDMTSPQFATWVGERFDAGLKPMAFVIGGADGLSASWREEADLVLRLGAMTWPHQLARALLAEQLYRAESILAGHPYHKA